MLHRTLSVLALATALSCCSASTLCTNIGAVPGIGLDAPAFPESDIQICLGPDCSNSFINVANPNPAVYDVIIVIDDGVERRIPVRVETTPSFPNGPDCGEGPAQAVVVVDSNGEISIR